MGKGGDPPTGWERRQPRGTVESAMNAGSEQGLVMDRVGEFLDVVKQLEGTPDAFRGLLHILIGRRVTRADGAVVSQGLTWREAAALLKQEIGSAACGHGGRR